MTTRDAFTAAKTRSRIGLKIYLMNRSSCLLLNFPVTKFAKASLILLSICLTTISNQEQSHSVNLAKCRDSGSNAFYWTSFCFLNYLIL